MRWIWIDRVLELSPRERLVAIKNISAAEPHLHDHFGADSATGERAAPVMPASLIIEGMAQTAGILVCNASGYREKVILAKVGRVELSRDATIGCVLKYTATADRIDAAGAATNGLIELFDPAAPERGFEEIGRIDLLFSHLDSNAAGVKFPEHNFVFTELFDTLLRVSGFPADLSDLDLPPGIAPRAQRQ